MKNMIPVLSIILLIALTGYVVFLKTTLPKVAYINIHEVYNGFELKKEMEQKYLKIKTARDKILDSLKFALNISLKKIDAQRQKDSSSIKNFQIQREEFLQKKESFEEDNTALSKQYDEQILNQLNQYVKDYGTANNYSLLLGNDGNGTVMYGAENLNKTKEVVDFINEKYKGIK